MIFETCAATLRKRVNHRRMAGEPCETNELHTPYPTSNESTPMTTTYYLLRTKESAIGNGAYLGHDTGGDLALITSNQNAHRFDSFEAAEQCAAQVPAEFGVFEMEVRNSEN
jgi:hypothetical protein